MENIISFLPILIMQLFGVFFVMGISSKIGLKTIPLTVLACIPLVGWLTVYYVSLRFCFFIADALNVLKSNRKA